MRMGASSEPSLGSMSAPGEGMARRKLSERGLYALVGLERRAKERTDSVDGNEKNILNGCVRAEADLRSVTQERVMSVSRQRGLRIYSHISRDMSDWHVAGDRALVVRKRALRLADTCRGEVVNPSMFQRASR